MTLSDSDRLAIADLAARYCHASDHRRADDMAALFSDDGVLEANGKVLADGAPAVRAFVAANRDARQIRRHWINAITIDGTQDLAEMRLYVACFDVTDAQLGAPYMMGEYHDTVVRTPDGWRFRHRRLTTIAGRSTVAAPAKAD